MTILCVSTELEGGGASDNSVSEVTDAGRFNSGLQRTAVRIGNLTGSTSFVTYNFAATADLWFHCNIYFGAVANNQQNGFTFIDFRTASGARCRVILGDWSSRRLDFQTFSSVAWVTRFSYTFSSFVLVELDINVKTGTSGRFAFYLGGFLLNEFLGAIDGPANFNQCAVASITGNATLNLNTYISQVIIADEITTGMRAYQRVPSGAGAASDWTGTFNDISEIITDDGTFINSSVAGDVSLFTLSSLSIPQGRVRSVIICMRGQNLAGVPDNLQGAVRISGINYFTPNISSITSGWTNLLAFFNVDPSTGLPWARAAAESATLQAGVRSQT